MYGSGRDGVGGLVTLIAFCLAILFLSFYKCLKKQTVDKIFLYNCVGYPMPPLWPDDGTINDKSKQI